MLPNPEVCGVDLGNEEDAWQLDPWQIIGAIFHLFPQFLSFLSFIYLIYIFYRYYVAHIYFIDSFRMVLCNSLSEPPLDDMFCETMTSYPP